MDRSPRRGRPAPPAAVPYEPPRYPKLVRCGLIGGVAFAIAALAYTVLWFAGASQLKAGVEEWIAQRSASGFSARVGKLEIGGYPLAFKLIAADPKLDFSPPPGSGQAAWSAGFARAVAEVAPWRRRDFRIELTGEHGFEFGSGPGRQAMSGETGRVQAVAAFDSEGFPEFLSLDLQQIDLKNSRRRPAYAVASARLSAERRPGGDGERFTPGLRFTIIAEGVNAPALVRLPLGNALQRVLLEARLVGDFPLENVLESLGAWRDQGGTLELDKVDIRYGQLGVQASGTLALDRNLQPIGALTARLEGFLGAIDALREADIIRTRDAAMAKLVLGSLAKRPAGGGPRVLSLPLSVQDRKLSAGPVPLMEIPEIRWPERAGETNQLRFLR